MTDHMQKAREIAAAIAGVLYSVTLAKKVDDLATRLIAAALSEAYRKGVEDERERCIRLMVSAADEYAARFVREWGTPETIESVKRAAEAAIRKHPCAATLTPAEATKHTNTET